MKKSFITSLIILLYLSISFSQELTEVDFEIKEKPWQVMINHELKQLQYYYHTTEEKEDIVTEMYTIDFDGKVLNKETERNSIAETKNKYPWYFYVGDKYEFDSYRTSFVAGSFVFLRDHYKMIYHPKRRFYEQVINPMKTKYKYIKYDGNKVKCSGVTNVTKSLLVEDKILCQISEFKYLISAKDHTDYFVQGHEDLSAEVKKLDYGRIENHYTEALYENELLCGYIVSGDFIEESDEYKSGKRILAAYVDTNGNVINVLKFDDFYSSSRLDENKSYYKAKENGKYYGYLVDNKLKVIEKKEINPFPIDSEKSTSVLRYKSKNSFHILFDINKVSLYLIDEENNILDQKELPLSFDLEEGYKRSFPLLTNFDDVFYTSISLESKKDKRAFLYIKTDEEKILSAKVNLEDNEKFVLYKDKVPKSKHFYNAGSLDYTLRFSESGGLIADYHYSHLERDGHSLLVFYDAEGNLIKTVYKEISAPESYYYILLSYYHPTTFLYEGKKNYYWISGTYNDHEEAFISVIDKNTHTISKTLEIDAGVSPNSVYSKDNGIYILDNEGKVQSIEIE